MINIEALKPGALVRGAIFPEPVKVISMVSMGGSIKLICEGLETGRVHQPVLLPEQIDALEVMAINAYWFLITPRYLGILLVLPDLNMISIFTLVAAAWGVAVTQCGLNGAEFLQLATANTSGHDLFYTLLKSLVFGNVICLVSCFYGFQSKPGPGGVGDATNAAVVVSAVSCAILNYFMSEAFYG